MGRIRTRRLRRVPVSSYRVQLTSAFGFDRAAEIVPYLAALGITELYCSPCTRARPGSTHGYDVCDYAQLNPELGGEEAYGRLSEALAAHDMGQIMDIVPNHMAADPDANAWWRDVLVQGARSPFARFFDIDWRSPRPELNGKVLVPVLAEDLDTVILSGDLKVELHEGGVVVRYGAHRYPVPANIAAEILRQGLETFNGARGDAASFGAMRALVERLPYRLDSWRTALEAINYRRFFTISDLVGVRVEDADVFAGTHQFILELVGKGTITGLRIDHLDGLWDPAEYLDRLQAATAPPIYLVVEKILSWDERLPRAWPIDGTTGYNFLNDLNGVFVDPAGAERLCSIWQRFTNRNTAFDQEVYEAKRLTLERHMRGEVDRLARMLAELAEAPFDSRPDGVRPGHHERRQRQGASRMVQWPEPAISIARLRDAIVEVVARFPLYRTYISSGSASEADRATIEHACQRARVTIGNSPELEFLRAVLGVGDPGGPRPPRGPRPPDAFVRRFQQLTGPAQAKGVEDTAFYRFVALLSANEVGGDPSRPSRRPSAFHHANMIRRADWPLELITTSTHDTKRGEDARARLNVLSELADDWEDAVSEWRRLNALQRRVAGAVPSANDEYLFYQALLGAWPAEPSGAPVPSQASGDLVNRMREYMEKATKEAKLHTSWTDPDPAYDTAVGSFVERTLSGPPARQFLAAFVPFARRVARVGMINALAQLTLKLAAPGVPDFYQGSEFWDFSLVDPDNRRPVDYIERRRLLEQWTPLLAEVDALIAPPHPNPVPERGTASAAAAPGVPSAAAALGWEPGPPARQPRWGGTRESAPAARAGVGPRPHEEKPRGAAASGGGAPRALKKGARRAGEGESGSGSRGDAGCSLSGAVAELLVNWPDSRIKLFLTSCGLRLRRHHPDLFRDGRYVPLEVDGPAADHVVAFARSMAGRTAIAAAPRLVSRMVSADEPLPLGTRCWQNTTLLLPKEVTAPSYWNLLTGMRQTAVTHAHGVVLRAADVFAVCPVALMWSAGR